MITDDDLKKPSNYKIAITKSIVYISFCWRILTYFLTEEGFKVFGRVVFISACITLLIKYISNEISINIANTITVSPSFIFWTTLVIVSFVIGRNSLLNNLLNRNKD
jgi:hypothetical protein